MVLLHIEISIRFNWSSFYTDEYPNIEQEIADLFEMVPFEKMMSLAMEYAIADQQVSSLLGYLSGPKFKENIVALENSPQFSQVYIYLNICIYIGNDEYFSHMRK